MKYFTKRKDNISIRQKIMPALILVSAFAIFISPLKAENSQEEEFTARKVFEKLQTSDLELLPASTRLDMLDYWDVDSVYKATNALEGLSWIEQMSPSYIKIRVTSASEYEIKILPGKKEKIILTIYTIGDDSQSQDSSVKFYDANMQLLPIEKHFVMPGVKDFFEIPKGASTKMKEIEEMIPFPTVALSAHPDTDVLTARLTVEKYINEDDWNIAKLFFKPSIELNWKKEKYKY